MDPDVWSKRDENVMNEGETASPGDEPTPTRLAYSIVDVDVHDPVAFAQYVKGHWDTVEAYGGKFLVAGGQFAVVEGKWIPHKVVMHQWPSVEAFYRWLNSEDYRPWKEMRQAAAAADVVLVEGV